MAGLIKRINPFGMCIKLIAGSHLSKEGHSNIGSFQRSPLKYPPAVVSVLVMIGACFHDFDQQQSGGGDMRLARHQCIQLPHDQTVESQLRFLSIAGLSRVLKYVRVLLICCHRSFICLAHAQRVLKLSCWYGDG